VRGAEAGHAAAPPHRLLGARTVAEEEGEVPRTDGPPCLLDVARQRARVPAVVAAVAAVADGFAAAVSGRGGGRGAGAAAASSVAQRRRNIAGRRGRWGFGRRCLHRRRRLGGRRGRRCDEEDAVAVGGVGEADAVGVAVAVGAEAAARLDGIPSPRDCAVPVPEVCGPYMPAHGLQHAHQPSQYRVILGLGGGKRAGERGGGRLAAGRAFSMAPSGCAGKGLCSMAQMC
jgi:hypothetical protein